MDQTTAILRQIAFLRGHNFALQQMAERGGMLTDANKADVLINEAHDKAKADYPIEKEPA